MARRKNHPEAVRAKFQLADRLRLVRTELFGDRGGPELARRLGVPVRTWYNYEAGVTVPSELVLRFIDLTSVEPLWLLNGTGPRYRTLIEPLEPGAPDSSIVSLLRTALHRLETAPKPPPQAPARAEQKGRRPLGGRTRAAKDAAPGAMEPATLAPVLDTLAQGAGEQSGGIVRMEGNAMTPIVADGAFVAFAEAEEPLAALEGQLVVAWIDNRPLVRWFESSERYALLRAENPAFEPPMTLLDLQAPPDQRRVRRVLWVGTPH